MKILFIGDIVGKPGRKGLALVLPKWKEQHKPDFIIANVENAAHGIGITTDTFKEILDAGVDFGTTGNHWADKSEGMALFEDKKQPIVRPANWQGSVPGVGYKIVEVGATNVAIINLLGQVFMKPSADSPFHCLDSVLKELPKTVKIILVDFQAEATSEKVALGWYADGRISALLGTHTHVPTADARVLSGGTGYVTDVGMCGARDSVIGDQKEEIVANFLDGMRRKHEIPEAGVMQMNAVLLDIDRTTGTCASIVRLDELVET